MNRRLKHAAVVILVLFAAAQLYRPQRANPTIDASRTIQAHMAPASELVAILNRACTDCHSYGTAWPWYTQVAPMSWLMALGVTEGRRALNFSEWSAYEPDQQRVLLLESCQAASVGRMPGLPYTLLHPEARLSTQEVETICAAARTQADAAERR
jgi:hypothetical protein